MIQEREEIMNKVMEGAGVDGYSAQPGALAPDKNRASSSIITAGAAEKSADHADGRWKDEPVVICLHLFVFISVKYWHCHNVERQWRCGETERMNETVP